jgi:predicted DCC family thiol-disulfide oxidoreductase YuxK
MSDHRTRSAWFASDPAPQPGDAGTFAFDADCPMCTSFARRTRPLLERLGFRLSPLQSADVRRGGGGGGGPRPRLGDDPIPDENKLLLADGRVLGGVDAIAEIARRTEWGWPLWALARVPGVHALLQFGYGQVAKRRHCSENVCRSPPAACDAGSRSAHVGSPGSTSVSQRAP